MMYFGYTLKTISLTNKAPVAKGSVVGSGDNDLLNFGHLSNEISHIQTIDI